MDQAWNINNISVGIITSLLASGVFALGGFSWPKVERRYRLKRFRKTFGEDVQKAADIVVSVPLWRALPLKNRESRFLKAGAHNHHEELYGPDEMFNRQDMRSAAYVVNVFGNQFAQEVKYTNDSEELSWTSKTVVIIGAPVANLHGALILATIRERIASKKSDQDGKDILKNLPEFKDMKEDEKTGARSYIFDPVSGREFRASRATEYGMVLRIPNIFADPRRFFIFFVGGIHASSTREAGRLFNEHWTRLAKGATASGFIFEMAFEEPGTGHIVLDI